MPIKWTRSKIAHRDEVLTVFEVANQRVGQMLNPPSLGELIRESEDALGWSETETAARLGCERGTLSLVLDGKAGVSADLALSLGNTGWGTAGHWVRMQARYELARALRARVDDAVG